MIIIASDFLYPVFLGSHFWHSTPDICCLRILCSGFPSTSLFSLIRSYIHSASSWYLFRTSSVSTKHKSLQSESCLADFGCVFCNLSKLPCLLLQHLTTTLTGSRLFLMSVLGHPTHPYQVLFHPVRLIALGTLVNLPLLANAGLL
jgi:hypothetical protein